MKNPYLVIALRHQGEVSFTFDPEERFETLSHPGLVTLPLRGEELPSPEMQESMEVQLRYLGQILARHTDLVWRDGHEQQDIGPTAHCAITCITEILHHKGLDREW